MAGAALLALAGCASPADVEQRWVNETNGARYNYDRAMPSAVEWNVRSIFNLPASGALAVILVAALLAAALFIALGAALYRLSEARLRSRERVDLARAEAEKKRWADPHCEMCGYDRRASSSQD